jgi:FkbH-like protein
MNSFSWPFPLPLSPQDRADFFENLQKESQAPSPVLLEEITAEKDLATALLLRLLLPEPQSAFPLFQRYLRHHPADQDFQNRVLQYLVRKYPTLLSPWLKTSPQTALSENLIRWVSKNILSPSASTSLSRLRIALLSSKNALFWKQTLGTCLWRYGYESDIWIPPAPDLLLSLQDPEHPLYSYAPQWICLALEPEEVYPAFQENFRSDLFFPQYAGLLSALLNCSSADILVLDFSPPPYHLLSLKQQRFYEECNEKLYQSFGKSPRLSFLSQALFFREKGWSRTYHSFRNFYANAPESSEFLWDLSREVTEWLRQEQGELRKCIVVDLDGTLWGGALDEGAIQISREYPGNIYWSLQENLKRLKEQGFVLAINSKNDQSLVLQTFHKKEMPLQEQDFVCIEADWSDKTEKMQRISKHLHLGLESFIFLDNDPVERYWMREAFPQVYTPELPQSPSDYLLALYQLPELRRFKFHLKGEDRTLRYQEENQRKRLEHSCFNREEFLKSLALKVALEPLLSTDFERIVELSKRANQFHLTGHRFSLEQLKAKQSIPELQLWTVSVSDHFGSYGMVGFLEIAPHLNARFVHEFFKLSYLTTRCRRSSLRLDF